MKPDTIIFDMDGTLIDSEGFWTAAEYSVFSGLGVDMSKGSTALTAGMSTADVTDYWYQITPWQGISLIEIERRVIDEVGERIAKQGAMIEGADSLLDLCRNCGMKVGLATNSPHSIVDKVLERFSWHTKFDCILTADDVSEPKPAPDIYLQGMQQLNSSRDTTVVVEDSLTGATASVAAGIKTLVINPSIEHFEGLIDMIIPVEKLSDVAALISKPQRFQAAS